MPEVEERFDQVEKRLDNVEHGLGRVERRLESVEGRVDALTGWVDTLGQEVQKLRVLAGENQGQIKLIAEVQTHHGRVLQIIVTEGFTPRAADVNSGRLLGAG